MTDTTNWNIILEQVTPQRYNVIMPNSLGELPKHDIKDGYLMQWPVNPHFTGLIGIIHMLKESVKFKDAQFVGVVR